MKMISLQSGSRTPEVYHLRPLRTYSSPSRRIVEVMLVASELATAGSVIAKAERILQFSKGFSHCCFCCSVPNMARISMLPVSGAEQLIASLPITDRPATSASGAYSRLVSPAPKPSWVMNRFHNPCAGPRPADPA